MIHIKAERDFEKSGFNYPKLHNILMNVTIQTIYCMTYFIKQCNVHLEPERSLSKCLQAGEGYIICQSSLMFGLFDANVYHGHLKQII